MYRYIQVATSTFLIGLSWMHTETEALSSPRNAALYLGYCNATVVPSLRGCVLPSVRPSVRGPCEHDRDYSTPLRVSLSNFADMLTMMRG